VFFLHTLLFPSVVQKTPASPDPNGVAASVPVLPPAAGSPPPASPLPPASASPDPNASPAQPAEGDGKKAPDSSPLPPATATPTPAPGYTQMVPANTNSAIHTLTKIDGHHQVIGKLHIYTDQVLGTGSAGTIVYAGKFDGRDVAVKRLVRCCGFTHSSCAAAT
jgi:hypothetical protein